MKTKQKLCKKYKTIKNSFKKMIIKIDFNLIFQCKRTWKYN